jgi:hypothetical protein
VKRERESDRGAEESRTNDENEGTKGGEVEQRRESKERGREVGDTGGDTLHYLQCDVVDVAGVDARDLDVGTH